MRAVGCVRLTWQAGQGAASKEILGIWIEQTEGAKFWLRVMNELKNRGVADILIAVVDGLRGFPEAINAVFPADHALPAADPFRYKIEPLKGHFVNQCGLIGDMREQRAVWA